MNAKWGRGPHSNNILDFITERSIGGTPEVHKIVVHFTGIGGTPEVHKIVVHFTGISGTPEVHKIVVHFTGKKLALKFIAQEFVAGHRFPSPPPTSTLCPRHVISDPRPSLSFPLFQ